jgi:anion-transporting  ArsA/GET3 family ATPase
LVTLSKSIKRVMAVLKDPQVAIMVAVAIPAQMSLSETKDLALGLDAISIPIGQLLINNVIPVTAAESCFFCRERRVQQLEYVEKFRQSFQSRAPLLLGPQMAGEVRGREKLREFWSSLQRAVERPKARGKGEA